LTDNVLGGSVATTQLIITVNTANASPARPATDIRLNEIFSNSAPYLCPVTYTFVVDNADSFVDDRSSRFIIDPSDTRMTFVYDAGANAYDGKTIHYKVKALTGANLPMYVTITVIDITTSCNLATLSFNNADVLSYPQQVYNPVTTVGATLNSIYTNDNAGLCPISEELILQSDRSTPANTLEGLIFYKDASGVY
jgi:hypothetical protein